MPSQQESSGDRASGSGVLSPSSNTFSSSVSTPCRVCYPPSSCGGVTSLSSSSRVSSEGKEKERREGSNVDPANDKTSLPLADEIKKKAESLDFQEIQHFSLKHLCIREWRCVHTQVRILVCRVESPICNLYMTFPTEAHTDEGLPHTLEHLVFLGSYQYPYKGVLDFLASRCLSQGTNAWTATDHTTYTLTTAGSEGLLNLLPVYLDHLLLPTLLPKAFKT
ncbi:peptidase m16 inactive domain-containing protein, partial [Cystoisospora suis]